MLPPVLNSCMPPYEPAPSSVPAATPGSPVEEKPAVTIPAPAAKQDPPSIRFTVNPSTITKGKSAVLSWNVTNATSVMIDHGVGSVKLSDACKITPAVSTIYTLTASNVTGVAVKIVSVIVEGAGPTPANPEK